MGARALQANQSRGEAFSPRYQGSAVQLRLRQHSLPRGQGLCTQTVDGRPLREQWRALGGYHSARAGELFLYGYRWQGDQGGVHLRLLPRLPGPATHQFAPLLLAFQAGVRAERGCFPISRVRSVELLRSQATELELALRSLCFKRESVRLPQGKCPLTTSHFIQNIYFVQTLELFGHLSTPLAHSFETLSHFNAGVEDELPKAYIRTQTHVSQAFVLLAARLLINTWLGESL